MKIIERLSLLLLLTTGICFAVFWYQKWQNADSVRPEIVCDTPEIEVGVNVTEEQLLEGVTAWDNRDGDLTDKILIASYSKFVDKGVRNIKLVVFDSHYNVAQMTRTVRYTDYVSPRFYLKKPLQFRANSTINLYDCIGATDCLDGDISDKIKVVYNDAGTSNSNPGEYEVGFQVSNSAGDVSYLTANVEIYEGSYYKPEILLSRYLLYVKQGAEFKPERYIEKTESALETEELTAADVQIYSTVNTSVPGNYEVRYSIVSENGYEGTSRLIVIVE